MPITNVLLEVLGTEAQLRNLDTKLQLNFIDKPRRMPSGVCYASLSVAKLEEEQIASLQDDQTIESLRNWLERNASQLRDCKARKVVEIQGVILLDYGCDGFKLPHELLALLVTLQCELNVQFSRQVRCD